MARRGRRPKLDDWLQPENLLLIRHWRRHGLTIEQTAKKMGVGNSTLFKWSSNNLDIREALKTGKAQAVAIVENKLFTKAMSGNLTAIIFYLKNNARNLYNDSQLSPEELKQTKAKTRVLLADARIKEAKAAIAERLGTEKNDQLDMILDKLVEEVGTDGSHRSDDDQADKGS